MDRRPTFKHRLEFLALGFVFLLGRFLPRSFFVWLGAAIGGFVHDVLKVRRSVTRANLRSAFPDMPEGERGAQSPTPDIRAVGVNTFPVPAGFCSGQDSFIWAFAINTWERQTHLLPVSHQVVLDTNQDGVDDYVILNRDLSGPTTIDDGRQVTWVLDLSTGGLSAFF